MDEDTDSARRERRVALGWAIRALRSDRSQADFGSAIGISQTRLSRWEHGDVDLSYEQVRRVERALGVALGTIARDAGYIEDALLTQPTTVIREVHFDSVEPALQAAHGGALLDFGVRVDNRWVPNEAAGDSHHEDWVVVLLGDAPGLPQ